MIFALFLSHMKNYVSLLFSTAKYLDGMNNFKFPRILDMHRVFFTLDSWYMDEENTGFKNFVLSEASNDSHFIEFDNYCMLAYTCFPNHLRLDRILLNRQKVNTDFNLMHYIDWLKHDEMKLCIDYSCLSDRWRFVMACYSVVRF
jgi:hypothetical protein